MYSSITVDTSLSLSSSHGDAPIGEVYESPVITTYTEAELLAVLGPAHAGSIGGPGDNLMNELLGVPEQPDW